MTLTTASGWRKHEQSCGPVKRYLHTLHHACAITQTAVYHHTEPSIKLSLPGLQHRLQHPAVLPRHQKWCLVWYCSCPRSNMNLHCTEWTEFKHPAILSHPQTCSSSSVGGTALSMGAMWTSPAPVQDVGENFSRKICSSQWRTSSTLRRLPGIGCSGSGGSRRCFTDCSI